MTRGPGLGKSYHVYSCFPLVLGSFGPDEQQRFAAADQVPCTEKQYRTAPELPCAPCDGAEGAIEGETMGDGCFFVWYVVPWYTTTIHHLLQS